MTLTQTVDIPDTRQITLDIPREVPTGRAQVVFKVIPFIKKKEKTVLKKDGKIRLTGKQWDEMMQNSPGLQKLSGILHTDMTIDEIRMERLAKHL